MRLCSAAVVLLALAVPAAAAQCPSGPDRTVVHLDGALGDGERYEAALGAGLSFVLEPDAWGWQLEVRDATGDDVSRFTPPFHFVPNPRDIHGWHFRNRANTGPNRGDVNAPQEIRAFRFDQGGEGSFEERARAAGGRGVLEITDIALTPPEPGGKARMTTLSFTACLSWPTAWDRD